jgi:hypothetical protein
MCKTLAGTLSTGKNIFKKSKKQIPNSIPEVQKFGI